MLQAAMRLAFNPTPSRQPNIVSLIFSQVDLCLSPEALLNQYRRIANIYFLAVAILSTIPGVTPLSPALIWLPLGIVSIVSLMK
jgi:hypothetical protein